MAELGLKQCPHCKGQGWHLLVEHEDGDVESHLCSACNGLGIETEAAAELAEWRRYIPATGFPLEVSARLSFALVKLHEEHPDALLMPAVGVPPHRLAIVRKPRRPSHLRWVHMGEIDILTGKVWIDPRQAEADA